MRDFRDLDTRLKAQVFLDELHALMVKHEASIECWGSECEGLELEMVPPKVRFRLPEKIYPGYRAFTVTLETEPLEVE